ncbi:DNA-3-methyladenine glycosylase II [Seinonella peptonophila]|uniref:DNA-3-methyladenine glycosylase II n=1 Tax=Seinonella peptonophila TaxID=112248 RepID=A0A1M5A6P5_9BACL|nr:DNA-3-methyladenine glycosylase [Seinonella peptonophila]SHF25807.1 DNA-3-methyladenine glycosylase II [Seinonella peptonophila]
MLLLTVPDEFSFSQTLAYLSVSSAECMYQMKDKKLYKLLKIDDIDLLIEISNPTQNVLQISFINQPKIMNEKIELKVTKYIQDWFDLDRDLVPFYQMAAHDPILSKIAKQFYGLRNIGMPSLFEALCWAIIGQQINLSFAYTLKRRFVETFGKSITWQDQKYWLFPTSGQIASLSIDDLTALKMTKKKAEYLIGVASLIESTELSKSALLDLMVQKGEKEAEKQLVKIRGIGPWTANYVMMRCLRASSAFPIDDVGLQNAMKFALGLDQKPTKDEIKTWSINWANWESYATFYLWRTLY